MPLRSGTDMYTAVVASASCDQAFSRTIKNVPREIRPMFWTCYNYNRLDYFNIYIDITVNDFICTLYLFYECESKTDLTVLYRRFIAALFLIVAACHL